MSLWQSDRNRAKLDHWVQFSLFTRAKYNGDCTSRSRRTMALYLVSYESRKRPTITDLSGTV